MRKRGTECVVRFLCAIFQLFVITELRQPQQIESCDGVRGWFRAVVIIFHAQRYARIFSARAEIAAVLFVEEQAVLRFLEFDRKLQPLDIEASFIKIDKPLDHARRGTPGGTAVVLCSPLTSV